MKTVEIHYGDDVFSNQLSSTSDKRLQSCKLHRETSFASDSLSIDYITYYVVSDTNLSGYFDYSTPQYLYDDGELVGVFYAPEVTKESSRFYKVKAYSDVELLNNTTHVGGIYSGEFASNLIAEIMGDIDYTLDSDVGNTLVYGWLPYDTARNNLSQLLFALGAGIYRDDDYKIYIRYAIATSGGLIYKPNIYLDCSEEESQAKTLARVYYHKYIKGGETITLLDETVSGEVTVIFDDPVYDLTISGGTITESGVNYAVISAAGDVTLTGTKYEHSVTLITKGDTDADEDYVSTVDDATLVSSANAVNVVKRVYNAGKYVNKLNYNIYDTNIVSGTKYYVETMDSGILSSVCSEADINFSARNRADCVFIVGEALGATNSTDISLSTNSVSVSCKEQTLTVTVTSVGSWTAYTSYSWVSLSAESGESGDEVTITISLNSDTSSRTAMVVFEYGDSIATLVITQEGFVYEISVSPVSASFTYDGGDLDLTVTSTADWTLDSYPTWITPSAESGEDGDTITATAASNSTAVGRTGKMSFSCGSASTVVPAVQTSSGSTDAIELSSSSGTFAAAGESIDIVVSSSDTWTAEASDDWITISASSGSSGDTVTVTVESQTDTTSRTGYVTFTCGSAVTVYVVTQEAYVYSIALSSTSINFDEYGDTETIIVTSSDDWTVEIDSGDWFTLSKTSGSSGSSISITAPPNYVASDLSGLATFTCGNATASLYLTQDADTGEDGVYSSYQILTEDSTFTVPYNVKRIYIALIGGGYDGSAGTNSSSVDAQEDSDNDSEEVYISSSKSFTNSFSMSFAAISATSGYAGGSGGSGGRFYTANLKVVPYSTYSITVGASGGGDSTFGDYTSADGSTSSSGYTDSMTGVTYCLPGSDGDAGGSGGAVGSSGASSSGSGGSGVSSSTVSLSESDSYSGYYMDCTYTASSSFPVGAGGGGGGGAGGACGGGSGGSSGSSGGSASTYSASSGIILEAAEQKAYIDAYPSVAGKGGKGGNGESASVYGCGGGGGGGAGGSGAAKACSCSISLTTKATDCSLKAYYTFHFYVSGYRNGLGAVKAGSGGAGAQGCVIIYY